MNMGYIHIGAVDRKNSSAPYAMLICDAMAVVSEYHSDNQHCTGAENATVEVSI